MIPPAPPPALVVPAAATVDTAAAMRADLRARLEKRLAEIEADLAKPAPTVSVRNLPNGALAALVLNKEPARAEALLRRLWALQDMRADSPTFGEVPWQMNRPEIDDKNANMFSTQALGPILLGWGNKLSPQFKAEMTPHIRAFFAALKRRQMRTPAYTNIFLMRAVNMILLGEAIGDKEAADWGYAQMNDWLRYTKAAGIHEFNSPTYTAVDLNSLGLGFRWAARPGAKALFKSVLDFFWTDIAANYFAGRRSYAGPHSRDYDFVGGGGGGTGYYLALAGLPDDNKSNMIDFEKVYPLVNTAAPGGYVPDPTILALARAPERIVRSRWDVAPGRDRYHFLTENFALGGASGDYGGEDNRSGHNKASHLPLGATCVQEKGALLALLDIDTTKAKGPTTSVATNLLLPARADQIVLDGAPVSLDKPTEIPARVGGVLGVRKGKADVAFRVFAADGEAASAFLKADADGLSLGVARLTAYHHRGPAQIMPANPSVKVGVLILAARCADEAAFAALLKRAAETKIEARTEGATWTRTAFFIGAEISPFLPLTVNGDDVAARLIDPLLSP